MSLKFEIGRTTTKSTYEDTKMEKQTFFLNFPSGVSIPAAFQFDVNPHEIPVMLSGVMAKKYKVPYMLYQTDTQITISGLPDESAGVEFNVEIDAKAYPIPTTSATMTSSETRLVLAEASGGKGKSQSKGRSKIEEEEERGEGSGMDWRSYFEEWTPGPELNPIFTYSKGGKYILEVVPALVTGTKTGKPLKMFEGSGQFYTWVRGKLRKRGDVAERLVEKEREKEKEKEKS